MEISGRGMLVPVGVSQGLRGQHLEVTMPLGRLEMIKGWEREDMVIMCARNDFLL